MHRRAGEAIEAAYGSDLEPYLSELAHHLAQAGLGDLDKALMYRRSAGAYALGQAAYEQAAEQFRRAVELIDAWDPGGRVGEHCDLVIAQGEAERQAGEPGYRQTLLDAARIALQLGDPERLAGAALANNRGIYSSGQGIDRERVEVLEAALDAYDPADSATRAKLLALLALELTTDHDPERRDALETAAVDMARRLDDERTLAQVLTQRCVSRWNASWRPEERRGSLREAGALAVALGDRLLTGHVAYLGAQEAMHAGDLDESDLLIAQLHDVAEELAQPFMRWCDRIARAKRRVISGPAREAEALAFDAFELGRRAGQPDARLWFYGQLIAARFLMGTLDDSRTYLPGIVPTPSATIPVESAIIPIPQLPLLTGAAMSMIRAEIGELDAARAFLEPVLRADFAHLPPDYTALLIPVYASVACARLGDEEGAARLYAVLEPRHDRLVTTVASWFGVVSHHAGVLAATLGRFDEADALLAHAEQRYTMLAAEPWLERLSRDRATALVGVTPGR
jgi:hypothetical protein